MAVPMRSRIAFWIMGLAPALAAVGTWTIYQWVGMMSRLPYFLCFSKLKKRKTLKAILHFLDLMHILKYNILTTKKSFISKAELQRKWEDAKRKRAFSKLLNGAGRRPELLVSSLTQVAGVQELEPSLTNFLDSISGTRTSAPFQDEGGSWTHYETNRISLSQEQSYRRNSERARAKRGRELIQADCMVCHKFRTPAKKQQQTKPNSTVGDLIKVPTLAVLNYLPSFLLCSLLSDT